MQSELFSPATVDDIGVTYLNVVKDFQQVNMSASEIFDCNLYSEIYAIAYVSSARFFSKSIKGFDKAIFIMGIDDSEVNTKFVEGICKHLDIKERINFWNNLEEETKENVQKNGIEIRFAKPRMRIHTKLYLLKNAKGDYRVVMGSANFSENAFTKNRQFKDILIFDNNKRLFEMYEERFFNVYEHTVDYIPEYCKKRDKKEVVCVTDPEILMDLLSAETKNVELITRHMSEEEMEEFKDVNIKLNYKKESYDTTEKVLELITKKKDNHYLIKPENIKNKSVALRQAICNTNIHSKEYDSREMNLQYNDNGNTLFLGENGGKTLTVFSLKAENSVIEQSLKVIHKFIDSYKLFTHDGNIEVQKKIYEIIIYAFMSPFIWKIREDHADKEGRNTVRVHTPPFLIIAGQSNSGKSTALGFINLLLGQTFNSYFNYLKVSKPGILLDYFYTENLFPIIVDEADKKLFTGKQSQKTGEAMIKHVSNELKNKHPVLITTTNQTDFELNSQVLKRVYYLEIDKVFKQELQKDTEKHLDKLLSETNNSLFKDFTYRMTMKIRNHDIFYSSSDFLSGARAIFADYYKEIGIEKPKYFPEYCLKDIDYNERGRKMWQHEHNVYGKSFVEQGNLLYVKRDVFGNDRKTAINYLPRFCIKEAGAVLILNKKPFMQWLKTNSHFKNKNQNNNLFRTLKRFIFN